MGSDIISTPIETLDARRDKLDYHKEPHWHNSGGLAVAGYRIGETVYKIGRPRRKVRNASHRRA